jgi:hypothetical protein
MFRGVVLAAALQLAQGTAADGLIHITCTIPADVVGGISFPALVDQIIVQPIKKEAWVNPSCGSAYTWPANITPGAILIHITCKANDGSTNWQILTIDRYTGTYTIATQGVPMTLSGQCVSGQQQPLF